MNDNHFQSAHAGWPVGESEMARLLRTHDWTGTPLGPIESWPRSLRTVTDIVLASPVAMAVFWGQDLVQIYNDAYRPFMSDRHPSGFGQPAGEGPLAAGRFDACLRETALRGEPHTLRNRNLGIHRHGPGEEAGFDLTFSPIRDDADTPAGALVTIIEAGRTAGERAQIESDAFRILTDTVPAFVWFASPDGQVHYLNRRWYEYTGQTPETALPDGWTTVLHKDDAERTSAIWAEARAKGAAYEVEMRYRRHDGAYRWYVARAEPVRNETGAITAWFGTSTDIHDHKIAEERLRLVQQAARIGSFDYDPEAGRVTCSPQYLELYGLPEDRPGGLPYAEWLAFIHEDDRDWIHSETQTAMADPARTRLDYEFRIFRADTGEMRWLASRTQLHRNEAGTFVRSVGAQWDVTERRTAEDELRASEARLAEERGRLATLIEHLPVGVNFMGLDGRTLLANPAFRGFVPSEVIPSRLPNSEEHWISHDENGHRLSRHQFPGARALRGETVPGVEFLHRSADGREIWTRVSGMPLRDVSGQLSGALAVIIDIDEQKRAQEALLRLNETLEARVEERSRELLVAEEALRQAQKMEAIGQLTGGVAHDFNNLLTIIRSSVDFLRRRELPEERRRRYVDAIADTVERASKLTGQLLAFARRQALKPEVFDVKERVRSTTEMMRTMVGSRVQVETDLECERCFVEADVSQFETALLNMAVNARDAMEGEGILSIGVRLLPEMPPIRGHAGSRERFVAVSVTDTGSGILPDRIAHIFEPFFTTKEVGKGTGLGLSQVYGFAKQSGGDVSVESEVGRGTTFILYLPQVEAEPEDAAAPGGPEISMEEGRGRRILVVEDNVDVGTFSTQLLQDLGYETTWAASADEALRLLAAGSDFDAVFTDVVMPGMGGVDLAREVRRRYPQIPVVLTSGYSHVLAEEGGRHGFELLHKPYAAEELSRVLRRAMRHHQRNR